MTKRARRIGLGVTRDPSIPWDPDWVVAPGETLKEWMDVNGMSVRVMTAVCGRTQLIAGMAVNDVLARKALKPEYADILERCTTIPANLWLALEHNYRVGLAAGKTNASGPVPTMRSDESLIKKRLW